MNGLYLGECLENAVQDRVHRFGPLTVRELAEMLKKPQSTVRYWLKLWQYRGWLKFEDKKWSWEDDQTKRKR